MSQWGCGKLIGSAGLRRLLNWLVVAVPKTPLAHTKPKSFRGVHHLFPPFENREGWGNLSSSNVRKNQHLKISPPACGAVSAFEGRVRCRAVACSSSELRTAAGCVWRWECPLKPKDAGILRLPLFFALAQRTILAQDDSALRLVAPPSGIPLVANSPRFGEAYTSLTEVQIEILVSISIPN